MNFSGFWKHNQPLWRTRNSYSDCDPIKQFTTSNSTKFHHRVHQWKHTKGNICVTGCQHNHNSQTADLWSWCGGCLKVLLTDVYITLRLMLIKLSSVPLGSCLFSQNSHCWFKKTLRFKKISLILWTCCIFKKKTT